MSVTLGVLASEAMGMAWETLLKGAVGEFVKDAYKAVKDRLPKRAAPEIDALEATPTSKARQAVVAEIIDAEPPGEVEALRPLVEALIAKLKENESATGLRFRDGLTSDEVDFSGAQVVKGTGMDVAGEAKIGKITAKGLIVGGPTSK